MARPAPSRMSYAEYLALEADAEVKHEYWAGEIVAMAGGTIEHGALGAAIIAALVRVLAGRPCRVYTSDVRVRVRETDLAVYPDVTVVCGRLEADDEDPHAIVNPVLLVEVLSDSTEGTDRGPKAAHYRRIPSLREYVFVSQREPHVEVCRRNEAGVWEIHEFRAGEVVELASVDARIPVDDVYRDPFAEAAAGG